MESVFQGLSLFLYLKNKISFGSDGEIQHWSAGASEVCEVTQSVSITLELSRNASYQALGKLIELELWGQDSVFCVLLSPFADSNKSQSLENHWFRT